MCVMSLLLAVLCLWKAQYDTMEVERKAVSAPEEENVDGEVLSKTQKEKERKKRVKATIVTEHVDLIRDEFWQKRPWLISGRPG